MSVEQELISTATAAEILERHVCTVHRMARAGDLPYVAKLPGKRGGFLFSRQVVELVAKQSQNGGSHDKGTAGNGRSV